MGGPLKPTFESGGGWVFWAEGWFWSSKAKQSFGPLHNLEGDPFTLRLFLKGKKGLEFNLGPSPNNPVMKGRQQS